MDDGAGSGNPLRQVGAAEAVERLHVEVLAQSESSILGKEGVVIVSQGAIEPAKLLSLPVADQQFGRRHASQGIK